MSKLRELNEKVLRYNIDVENNKKILQVQLSKLISALEGLDEPTLMDIMAFNPKLVDMDYLSKLPSMSNGELQDLVNDFKSYLSHVERKVEVQLSELQV